MLHVRMPLNLESFLHVSRKERDAIHLLIVESHFPCADRCLCDEARPRESSSSRTAALTFSHADVVNAYGVPNARIRVGGCLDVAIGRMVLRLPNHHHVCLLRLHCVVVDVCQEVDWGARHCAGEWA